MGINEIYIDFPKILFYYDGVPIPLKRALRLSNMKIIGGKNE
jgi:hypothetical protein